MRISARTRRDVVQLLGCAAWLMAGGQGGLATAAYHLGVRRRSVAWVVAVYARYSIPYDKSVVGLFNRAAAQYAEAAQLVEEGVIP